MSKVKEVVGMINKGSYGLVEVIMEDGTEASIYCGGDCEVYFDKSVVKAWVKRPKKEKP